MAASRKVAATMKKLRRYTTKAGAHYLQLKEDEQPWQKLTDEWSDKEIVYRYDFQADNELERFAGFLSQFGETVVDQPYVEEEDYYGTKH